MSMAEIVFEVTQEADGGLVAECWSESIITQADSWDPLRGNVKEAVAAWEFGGYGTSFRGQRPNTSRGPLQDARVGTKPGAFWARPPT